MLETREMIAGDTPGVTYAMPVLRFDGTGGGRTTYIQGALHAQEWPGAVAIHCLVPKLLKAEMERRLRARITVVPHANPIGLNQSIQSEHMGRFDLNSRTNFNRAFALPGTPAPDAFTAAPERLKARLLDLSADADIVLDLHCDDEAPVYLYVPSEVWPETAPLAAALNAQAVLVWDGEGGGAFEDAVAKRFMARAGTGDGVVVPGKVVSTVELRGVGDVSRVTAEADAEGLYRFLVAAGVIDDATLPPLPPYAGPVIRQEWVEMIRAPASGAVFYDKAIGDAVTAGETLATLMPRPGDPSADIALVAPRDGFVLTRRTRRFVRHGDDVLKLATFAPSPNAKPGPLEA